MIILQWSKTQILCLMILIYIGINYIREGNRLNKISASFNCSPIFDAFYIITEVAVLFDGITACTINYLDRIPRIVNLLAHLCMFVSYEIYVVLLFWYWVSVTVGMPKGKWVKAAYILPNMISVLLTIYFLPNLDFIQGKYTNYSMGSAVYVCFGSIIIYCVLTIVVIISKYRYISKKKRQSLAISLVFIAFILALQIMIPESLISCMAATMVTVSIYLSMENTDIYGLEHYQHEMVMGFATLVESRDSSTGGHVKRTQNYVKVLLEEIKRHPSYSVFITKDFEENIFNAAPMHDIGKISTPDTILQKPGKLTDEEYAIMKEHAKKGGEIIRETFKDLEEPEFLQIAYDVARFHHEKWNGKGYPDGKKENQIPFAARIMAIADVFDAVSAKRCYRDALPLETCFKIIQDGSGTDFDPELVKCFFHAKDKIVKVYNESNEK